MRVATRGFVDYYKRRLVEDETEDKDTESSSEDIAEAQEKNSGK